MKMDKILLIHASQLVTVSGTTAKCGKDMSDIGVIKDGAVLMEEGWIRYAGPTKDLDLSQHSDAMVIDCTGKTVLPGFVDSHTHFIFGGYRPEEFSWRLTGVSYMDIMQRGGGINATTTSTRLADEETLTALGRKRLDDMLAYGVTTVEGKSGYGLDKETELRQLRAMKTLDKEHAVDVASTFMGAHAVPQEWKGRTDDYVDYILREVLPAVAEERLAEFCDVFCEDGVFDVHQSRKLLLAAKELGLKLKLHADEIVPIGGTELAAEVGAVSADHLLHSSEVGIKALAKEGVVATLLPATAFSLKEPYANARNMIDSGCSVALASDFNPGSCFTHSIPLLIALATIEMNMTIEETIAALTINGAAALGRAEQIGSLEPGKKADIIVLEYPDYHFLNYHFAMNIVEMVFKNGTKVYQKNG
jgi:imidazolonepropionase